jgi:hypothetical protein
MGALAGIFGILSTANRLNSLTQASVRGRTDLWFIAQSSDSELI